MTFTDVINNSEIIIIKIGSALVTKAQTGKVRHYWMSGIAKDIAALLSSGKKVCIVCSGAIALGRHVLGLPHGTLSQSHKRVAAACGQIILMKAWQEVFSEDNIAVAQLLLTIDDSESRQRYLNASTTLRELLKSGVVPVINENDTVASAELKVGDNDRLGARVAQMISADMLVLLSDIDGLYTADPGRDPEARFISDVDVIDDVIRSYAAPAVTSVGTGGMITKLVAAQIANSSGCHTVIGRGTVHRPIQALLQGHKCTIFKAQTSPLTARKEWISGALSPQGSLIIDDGACAALKTGKSLLPVGVKQASGSFDPGDAVNIYDIRQRCIAVGITRYSHYELEKIMHTHSRNIEEILGYERGNVLVHRNDMVMHSC